MKDERRFRDVVETIVQSEDDVDTILKAARLTRQEKSNALTAEHKFYLLIAALVVLGFAVLCCSMNLGSYIRVLRYK